VYTHEKDPKGTTTGGAEHNQDPNCLLPYVVEIRFPPQMSIIWNASSKL
jgi:hypothetical protein